MIFFFETISVGGGFHNHMKLLQAAPYMLGSIFSTISPPIGRSLLPILFTAKDFCDQDFYFYFNQLIKPTR